jgi:hypothetical protein
MQGISALGRPTNFYIAAEATGGGALFLLSCHRSLHFAMRQAGGNSVTDLDAVRIF